MDTAETITEAVEILTAKGYSSDFALDQAIVHCRTCGAKHPFAKPTIRHTFRFEGDSDPGDEAIVLGIECPACNRRGIIVSAYGPDADPHLLALLDRLAE